MSRHFDSWIQGYLEYTQHTEAPAEMHFWTAISTIAGALRRRVFIQQGFFEWTPNFYIVLVARPGVVQKSTTVGIGMRLLKQVPGIHFGPSAITWQALVSSLSETTEGVQMDDGTMEVMSPITIEASEMGTLIDPRNREMIDVLVDLWDGKRVVWEKKTKTQGNDSIENPWINIIACTTPSWIAENFPESMIGGGFASRCIFVYADQKVQLVAYPSKHVDAKQKKLEQNLIRDLEHISMLKGHMTLSRDALQWGEEYYHSFHRQDTPEAKEHFAHLSDPRFANYTSRRQTNIHKIAMVISAAKRSNLVVEVEDLAEAELLLTSTEKHALGKIFDNIGKVPTAKVIDRIVEVLRTHGMVQRSALSIDLARLADPRTINDVLNFVTQSGLVVAKQHGSGIVLVPGPNFYSGV